jgi:MFS transporter, BCD family, chlorophyll transporter
MGLWGAPQAIAAGFGGLLGAAPSMCCGTDWTTPTAFGTVFLAEALVPVAAAAGACRGSWTARPRPHPHLVPGE